MQLPQDRSSLARTVTGAFPSPLIDDAAKVLAVLPETRLSPMGHFEVEVRGEVVAIPSRIYNEEPDAVSQLTRIQREMLHCLYTRQSDGYGRQRHLEMIVESTQPWVVPFVMQLAGEYVLEILEVIREGLTDLADPDSARRSLYGEFIAHNQAFFARTERRVVSYWTCYYRRDYPVFGTYPGSVLMEAFRAAASEYAGHAVAL
ncbi:hypothetical protein ACFQ3B_01345 [Stackebrandtia endophytica]|uniref:hypothetical protein n=1 Tax=Stackebrandtia endophytica TaxID=1496996 RepID=UPI001B85DA34|nr:hypothetical protein [Stackebrandtia endophytica]